jgi:hypothetical protein
VDLQGGEAWRAARCAGSLSALLTALWLAWGQAAYAEFFARTARPLLEAFGAGVLPESPAKSRFVSYVPFLVLMCGTPGLAWRRRLGGILLGVPLIFACHAALVAVEFLSHSRHRPTGDAFSTLLPAALFADAFPFLLWGLFASDVLRGLLEPRDDPGGGSA